jgi:hypothetical protein
MGSFKSGKTESHTVFFSKTDTKLVVELHNDFTLCYFPRRLHIEEFFGRQIRVCLDGHEAPTLSVEDELVLICIHGSNSLLTSLNDNFRFKLRQFAILSPVC